MNFSIKYIFLLSYYLLSSISFANADQIVCPNGQYRVRAHFRIGYVRSDGVLVKPSYTSPEEDYANNLEYFIYNPDKLKQVTPNAYEWIKKRFGPKLKLKERK